MIQQKIPVAVLGATGMVGQKFIELLLDHPYFEIAALAASERSVGKRYGEAANWLMGRPLPREIAEMVVEPCKPTLQCKIAFSGLDSTVAGTIEQEFASSGYIVISNSKNHRMNHDVPLVVPEVNFEHLSLTKSQNFSKGGMIVTNPNCSVVGLVMALKPLNDIWGIESAHVMTMQALSGAGYPGVASLDIIDNVIPYISDEEDKLETEPQKILGSLDGNSILYDPIKLSAQCNRVSVIDGHTECVSVTLKKEATREDIIEAWRSFKGSPEVQSLPSSPDQPIYYFDEPHFPQPKRHRNIDKGMAVSTGRLRPCPLGDWKFVLLSHNTIRGAAGGAILNAEAIVEGGFLKSE